MTPTTAMRAFRAPAPGESVAAIARILVFQGVVGLATAALAWFMAGSLAGSSALLGALICVLPATLFGGWIAVGILFANVPRLQLHGFYVGEVFKLAVTVVLFTLVFRFVEPLAPLFLFTGFIVTQGAMLWALLRG